MENQTYTKTEFPKCKCGNDMLRVGSKFCSMECYDENRTVNIPKVTDITESFRKYKSFVQVGKFFGVSDNAVRKWIDKYGISDMITTMAT